MRRLLRMQEVELLKKKLLKQKLNYDLLYKKNPEDRWYQDISEGIGLAIVEFNSVFGGK
jgi:hypothetical protein